MGNIKVYNALISSYTPGSSGEVSLTIHKPISNVSVVSEANLASFILEINSLLDGTKQSVAGCTTARVYYGTSTVKSEAQLFSVPLTNGTGLISIPYQSYYWVDAYNYANGSYQEYASGQMRASSSTVNLNYYSITINRGANLSSTSVSQSQVLSGTSVTLTATKGSEQGYTYSDTINWESSQGNLGTFTTTSGRTISKTITAKTVLSANTTRERNLYTVTVVTWKVHGVTINSSVTTSRLVTYQDNVSLTFSADSGMSIAGVRSTDISSWIYKGDDSAKFTMPAKNVTVYIAACGDGKVDDYRMSYESKELSTYSGSSMQLPYTSADFTIDDYDKQFEIRSYAGRLYICTGNDEGTTDTLPVEWHGIYWNIQCEVYTVYNVSISGDGHCTPSVSTISIERKVGSKQINFSFVDGFEYSSVSSSECVANRSGNVLTISNVTSASASVTIHATQISYILTMQIKVDDRVQALSGTSFRVYQNTINTKSGTPTIVPCNSSGRATINIPYQSYYWIEAYDNTDTRSWVEVANGIQPIGGTTQYAEYYTINTEDGGNIDYIETSHNPVLRGTSVQFKASIQREPGYTYDDNINWTGTLGAFTTSDGAWSSEKTVYQTVSQTAAASRSRKEYPLQIITTTDDCPHKALEGVEDARVYTSSSNIQPSSYTTVDIVEGIGTINIPFENYVWVYAYNPGDKDYHLWETIPGKESYLEIVDIHYREFDVYKGSNVSSVWKSAEWVLSGGDVTVMAVKANKTGHTVSDTITWSGDEGEFTSSTGKSVVYTVGNGKYELSFIASCTATPNTYTATFKYNYGVLPDTIKSITYGDTLTVITPSGRTGYTFNGWDSSIGTKKAGDSFIWDYDHDITFTANWSQDTYTITTTSGAGPVHISVDKNSLHYGESTTGTVQLQREWTKGGTIYSCRHCNVGGEVYVANRGSDEVQVAVHPEIDWFPVGEKIYLNPMDEGRLNQFYKVHFFVGESECDCDPEYDEYYYIYLAKSGPYSIDETSGKSSISPSSNLYIGNTFSVSNVRDNIILHLPGSFCLIEGTKILMADGTEQCIEDIKKFDKLMSFNPYTKELCSTTVLSVLPVQEVDEYTKITFENGTELCTANGHGLFNMDTMHGFDISGNPTRTISAVLPSGETTHNVSVEKVTKHAKIYSIITSLGLYFSNGVLSYHRALQKYNVLSSGGCSMFSREVQNVIKTDYDDYMRFLKFRYTPEYAEARSKFERRREMYTIQIFNEFNKLGVDMWEELEKVPKHKGYRLELIKQFYEQYKGQSETLDRLYIKRTGLEHQYYLEICRIQGVQDGHNAPAELFERCFKRDLAIEHLI